MVDPKTGEEIAVELFVGVLGASSLIYAEATRTQDLPSWIGAHVRMLDYFQGSPAIWVPDNLKSGVTTASRYDPEINRTYADLARHYGAVVIPARVATPTDKPKVEVSVQIAQRWVLAALRHQTFFSLADLNAAIGERVDAINARPMKITGVSRRALFEQLDRPALLPVPRTRYELAEWKPCRVNIDYHVEVAHNFYSVPYQLVHMRVEARFTASTVEIIFKGRRIASHVRLTGRGRFATQLAHMPRAHRAHAEWTPSRLIAWAEQTGLATGRLVAGSRGGRSAIKPFDLIIVGSGAAAFGAAIEVNDLRSVHAVAQSTAVVLDTIGAAGQTVAARPVPHGSALLMNPAHVHLMLNHFSFSGWYCSRSRWFATAANSSRSRSRVSRAWRSFQLQHSSQTIDRAFAVLCSRCSTLQLYAITHIVNYLRPCLRSCDGGYTLRLPRFPESVALPR